MASTWIWDEHRQLYYRESEQGDCYIYADGTRIGRDGQTLSQTSAGSANPQNNTSPRHVPEITRQRTGSVASYGSDGYTLRPGLEDHFSSLHIGQNYQAASSSLPLQARNEDNEGDDDEDAAPTPQPEPSEPTGTIEQQYYSQPDSRQQYPRNHPNYPQLTEQQQRATTRQLYVGQQTYHGQQYAGQVQFTGEQYTATQPYQAGHQQYSGQQPYTSVQQQYAGQQQRTLGQQQHQQQFYSPNQQNPQPQFTAYQQTTAQASHETDASHSAHQSLQQDQTQATTSTLDRYDNAEAVTDPKLFVQGARSFLRLRGTPGEQESFDPDFRIQRPGKKFFKFGKIFKVYWPEPMGQITTGRTSVTGVVTGQWKQKFFAKIRWFVVIKPGLGDGDYCSCLPIQTYGNQGVAKKGVVKGHHSIIHTTRDEPQPNEDEIPDVTANEAPMLDSIRAVSEKKIDTMHRMSRINYAKIYTVEHNVKVYDFGRVHKSSKHILRHQFNKVWRISESEVDDDDDDDDYDDDAHDNDAAKSEPKQKSEPKPKPDNRSKGNSTKGDKPTRRSKR